MRRLSIYFVFFFLLLLVVSCNKKKYPDALVEQTNIVFRFDATIDNKPVSIKAGVNDYYMYASFMQDSSGVYNFFGELKQTNCTNCANTIKIQINDSKISSLNEDVNVDSALQIKSYNFSSGITAYEVTFQSLFNKPAAGYYWDFGDGTSSDIANPIHLFPVAKQFFVSLKANSTGACESFIGNTQNIDATLNTCKSYIRVNSISGNTVEFIQNTAGGKTPYKYLWNFGDGDSSTLVYPTHTYAVGGSYPVSLKITDAAGVETYVNYNVVTQNDISSCAANYFIKSIAVVNTPSLSLEKVIITWTDADGTVYTSKNGLQSSASKFEILSVEDFGNNENNQATKKLKLKFNCTLFNGNKSVVINNAEADMAVSYK